MKVNLGKIIQVAMMVPDLVVDFKIAESKLVELSATTPEFKELVIDLQEIKKVWKG